MLSGHLITGMKAWWNFGAREWVHSYLVTFSCALWSVQVGAHMLESAHVLQVHFPSAFSLGNGGQEVLQRKDNYFPPPLCFSSQKSGLNWKPVKQIRLISSVKLSWSAPRRAVENWGKPEEGFVKMKKTRATKCTCVYVCVCAHRTKEKGELWSC